MLPFGNGFRDHTRSFDFNQDFEDECEDLAEEECNAIKKAVDVSFILAMLDCSYEDMEEVLGQLADLFDGRISEIDHTCFNGSRIKILVNGDGTMNIETDPPLDLEKDGG